jgi:hypothetical protein
MNLVIVKLLFIVLLLNNISCDNYHQHHYQHHHRHHRHHRHHPNHNYIEHQNHRHQRTLNNDWPLEISKPKYIANITVKVGDTVTLSCEINSSYGSNPGVIWMQGKLGNVLTLNTNRITVDGRFEISQQPLNRQQQTNRETVIFEPNLKLKRQQKQLQPTLNNDQNSNVDDKTAFYHLKINNVQIFDDNEYACETSISKQNEDESIVHSLIYLHVTRKLFI